MGVGGSTMDRTSERVGRGEERCGRGICIVSTPIGI